jgi:hypothetical protein
MISAGAREDTAIAGTERDVVIVWVGKGSKPGPGAFDGGERWGDLDAAVVHAREQGRPGMDAWIRIDGKFVLSPEDVAAAYAQCKEKR